MVQKIHPRGVIWVPSSRLMWADQLKKIDSSSVHILRSPWATAALMAAALRTVVNMQTKAVLG